jgi:uncharacterized protein YndB with AHSA1/START domain
MKAQLGVVTKHNSGYQVKLERVYNQPIQLVWDAITQPAHLAVWFTDIEMDFQVGGKIVIRFRDEAKTESYGTILRIEAPKLFEFAWENELATWQLFQEGQSRCRLVLTYSKLPDSYAISVSAGWHILLDQLESYFQGNREPYPFGGPETEESKPMMKAYRDFVLKDFPELLAIQKLNG